MEVYGQALVRAPGPLGDTICFEVERKDSLGGGGASSWVTLSESDFELALGSAGWNPRCTGVRQDPWEGDVMSTGSRGQAPQPARSCPPDSNQTELMTSPSTLLLDLGGPWTSFLVMLLGKHSALNCPPVPVSPPSSGRPWDISLETSLNDRGSQVLLGFCHLTTFLCLINHDNILLKIFQRLLSCLPHHPNSSVERIEKTLRDRPLLLISITSSIPAILNYLQFFSVSHVLSPLSSAQVVLHVTDLEIPHPVQSS